MIRMISADCPKGQGLGLEGLELENQLAALPVNEELALAPSMMLMVPTEAREYATLGLDAEIGPYLTKRHDRTFARRLRQNLWPFVAAVQEVSQAVFTELQMANRFRAPPRIIPY